LGPRFDIRDDDLDSLPDSPHLAGSIPAAGLPLEMARTAMHAGSIEFAL
jgi:hypothetical protein